LEELSALITQKVKGLTDVFATASYELTEVKKNKHMNNQINKHE